MKPKRIFEVYQESSLVKTELIDGGLMVKKTFEPGDWRFRVVAQNNRIVGGSQEAFDSKSNALRAARREASLYPPGVALVEVLE